MWNGIHDLPGVHVLGILMMTKAWWVQVRAGSRTTYLLADVPDIETVHAACNLFRTTVVGEEYTNFGNIAKLKLVLGVN